MGYSLSWLAVRGNAAEAFIGHFGLVRSGERCDPFESPFSLVDLANGWSLLFIDMFNDEYLNTPHCAALSHGGELIAFTATESAMFSASEGWRDGARLWRAVHKGDEDPRSVDMEGEPPLGYKMILNWAEAEQDREADVDYFFEVPARLAQLRTSFSYAEPHPEIADRGCEVVVPAPSAKRGARIWQIFRRGGAIARR